MIFASGSAHPDVAAALRDCRRAFWSVALFSGIVNLLMLAGPLYMLQIYDRVLSSRSIPTLIALSVFLVGAYAFQGALDLIRSRVVVRAAALARPAPGPDRSRHGGPPRRCEPASGRSERAGARPRSDPRLPDRCRADRHRGPAVDSRLPVRLLPHPSLARHRIDRRRHRAVRDNAAHRTCEPRAVAYARAGREHAVGPDRGRPAQQRDHRCDGNDGRIGEALGADQ